MFIIKEGTPTDKVGEGTTADTIATINKYLEKQGYTIRTVDQDTKYTQQKIDEAFFKRNNQLEQTIKEITGIEPKAEEKEKYFDFLKRAMSEKLASVQGSQTEVTALKAKIAELEKGGGNATVIEEYKVQLKTAQEAVATTKKEYEAKLASLQGDVFNGKVSTHIEKAMAELRTKLKKLDFPEDVIAARLAKFEKENKAAEFEGMIIFKDPTGATRTSKKDGKVMTAAEILQEEIFADLIDTGRKAGGAGSGGAGAGGAGGGKEGPAWKNIQIDKTVINNRQALYKTLTTDHGLAENSKDFNEAFAELGKDLPIRPKS